MRTGILLAAVWAIMRASLFGGLLLASILAVEWLLVHKAGFGLIASGENAPPVGVFPQVTVTVLAAFVGFYLATVGIVLGNSYEEVSARVRALILDSEQTRFYLATIGFSIGAGLLLTLLQSLGVLSYGYLALAAYALLVCIAARAFWTLADGAFNLMNPVVLAGEPLRNLGRAIDHLDSDGFLSDDAVLQAVARSADGSLRVLAELVELTQKRESVDRSALALMVSILCIALEEYAKRKHQLAPDSGWFLRETSYPRWIETGHTERSLALETARPLQVRSEPVAEWLERRAAHLIVATLNACVATDDRDAALRILNSAGQAARGSASYGRIEDAMAFAAIIRDGCWSVQSENATASAISGHPPVLLVTLLIGWNSAVKTWPEEIVRTVDETEWDNWNTRKVEIRASAHVWTAAQHALQEVRAEHDIEGRRMTPDWYLRSALAWECVLSIREFADGMPSMIREYVSPDAASRLSPEARALAGLQSFQLLERAGESAGILSRSTDELKALHRGHEHLQTDEVDSLSEELAGIRPTILKQLAEALVDLSPVHGKAEPDYFGHTHATLVHQLEEAIAEGNGDIVRQTFRHLIRGTLAYHEHAINVYRPPRYQFTPAILNPLLDLFELSGLALVYAALRGDDSAEPILAAWRGWLGTNDESHQRAQMFLDVVDVAARELLVSPTRMEWRKKLANEVKDAGFGIPSLPLRKANQQRLLSAPRLIRMLGILDDSVSLSIDSYELFAGEIIAPATGLSGEAIRERRALRRYFDRLDLMARQDREIRSDPLDDDSVVGEEDD